MRMNVMIARSLRQHRNSGQQSTLDEIRTPMNRALVRVAKLSVVLPLLIAVACSPSAPKQQVLGTKKSAVISNGDFESGGGALTGWTVTRFQNSGITTFPPTQMSDLGLKTASTTVSIAMTVGQNIVSVPSTASFAGGTSMLQIDNEVMTYAGVSMIWQ